MGDYTVYIDGVAKGNPGPSGIGLLIFNENGNVIKKVSEPIGMATNNQAEYRALIRALEVAKLLKIKRMKIYSDSELLVNQLRGIYKIKDRVLQNLAIKARNLMEGIFVEIFHIPREENKEADKLANLGIEKEVLEEPLEVLEQKEEIQISAGGVVYKKVGGKVMVCLVSKKGSQVWALPKGRVKENETPEESARREVLEETGNIAEVKEKIEEIEYYFYWKENNTLYHKRVYFYLMPLVKEGVHIKDFEVDRVEWFSLGDAYKKLTYLNEKEVLRRTKSLLFRR